MAFIAVLVQVFPGIMPAQEADHAAIQPRDFFMYTVAAARLSCILVCLLLSCSILSLAAPAVCAAERFTGTGAFVVTPAGQLRFEPETGKPDVLYEVGGAPGNYYDYLGVRVRVEAVVEDETELHEVESRGRQWYVYNPDEATGDTRPMRFILLRVESVTPLDAGFQSTRRTSLPYYGTPGTDPVAIAFLPEATCYSWGGYLAVETADHEYDTAALCFLARNSGTSLEDDCSQTLGREIMASDAEDSCSFQGGSGDVAIMDCGTGPDPRRLMVLDLKRESVLLDAWYRGEGEDGLLLRDNRLLEWTAEVPEPLPRPACPEAARWDEYGLSISYKQLHTLDLGTGATTAQGRVVCAPAQ
jgi:hypothetical protein